MDNLSTILHDSCVRQSRATNLTLTGAGVDLDRGQLHEVPADDDDSMSEGGTLGHHQVVQGGEGHVVTAE